MPDVLRAIRIQNDWSLALGICCGHWPCAGRRQAAGDDTGQAFAVRARFASESRIGERPKWLGHHPIPFGTINSSFSPIPSCAVCEHRRWSTECVERMCTCSSLHANAVSYYGNTNPPVLRRATAPWPAQRRSIQRTLAHPDARRGGRLGGCTPGSAARAFAAGPALSLPLRFCARPAPRWRSHQGPRILTLVVLRIAGSLERAERASRIRRLTYLPRSTGGLRPMG